MPVRVGFIDEAVEDLAGYVETDVFPHLLAKLVRLEEVGKDVGLPLGKALTNWRKIVVGDRAWRIIFTTNQEETMATVWVIGDRDDAACYELATRRVEALPKDQAHNTSLAGVMYQLSQRQRAAKRKSRGKKR
jgi:mRNA-degrading endonuclease RelE of RelBE toxin-antitoxin system